MKIPSTFPNGTGAFRDIGSSCRCNVCESPEPFVLTCNCGNKADLVISLDDDSIEIARMGYLSSDRDNMRPVCSVCMSRMALLNTILDSVDKLKTL